MDSLASMFTTWVLGLVVLLVLQFFAFLYGYRRKRIDVIDVFWGLSFIVVGLVYLMLNISNLNIAIFVAFLCIAVWGLRLSSYIFVRFMSMQKQDERYTNITGSFSNNPLLVYVKVFAVQAVLASLVMLVFLVAVSSPQYSPFLLVAGMAVWIFGFIFESVADSQLKKHIALKSGELLKTGLWKYSRHPNYFGELVQWWAIWLMLAGGSYAVMGLAGPVLISVLVIFVSGIPPLEKHMAEKKDWQNYKKSTSILIPWFNHKT